jgi:hypothetical protein
MRNAGGLVGVSGTAKVKVREIPQVTEAARSDRGPEKVETGRRAALVTGASRGIGAAITRARERPGDAMIVRGDTL